VIPSRSQDPSSLLTTPVSTTSSALFSCDDPALMAQYLSGYPPLQPEPVMGLQPSMMHREEMVYPNMSPTAQYPNITNITNRPHGPSDVGAPPQPYLVDTTTLPAAIPGYPAGGETSPYDGHGIVVTLPSRFHAMPSFDVASGAESVGVRDEPAILDFLPAHRTTPVKRGPFKDQDSREKTALTRKMGSCIRCRMQRIRVSSNPPPRFLDWCPSAHPN
jgi:hypothetical protein